MVYNYKFSCGILGYPLKKPRSIPLWKKYFKQNSINSSMEKPIVYDPNDVARTTIKETLIHNNRKGNVKGPNKLTVYDPNDVAKTTIKETLIQDLKRVR